MGMKLLGNSVLLEPLMPEKKSKGGIWYDMKRRDDRMQYWVLAVGPGRRLRGGLILPPEVRTGDRCLCNPDGLGIKHKFDDGRILVDAGIIQMIWR